MRTEVEVREERAGLFATTEIFRAELLPVSLCLVRFGVLFTVIFTVLLLALLLVLLLVLPIVRFAVLFFTTFTAILEGRRAVPLVAVLRGLTLALLFTTFLRATGFRELGCLATETCFVPLLERVRLEVLDGDLRAA